MRSMRIRAVWLLFVALCMPTAPVVAQQTLPEPKTVLSGTITVVQEDDFVTGNGRLLHRLRDAETGQVFQLVFGESNPPRLNTGDLVTVEGHLRTNALVVSPDGVLEVQAPPATRSAGSAAHSALILVVDFQDEAVACTDTAVADKMFTGTQSVDGLFQETSFGAVSFPADTDGDGDPDVVRVSLSASISDACDPHGWADDADAAAVVAGYDPTVYQHRVYVLPTGISCGWSGYAFVGCSSGCRAWNKYCQFQDVYAHELGHNLGLRHSSTDPNNDGVIDCTYCDTSDFMGYGGTGWRQVNGPHKHQMGWIPPEQVLDVTPGAPATHFIPPLTEDPAAAPLPQVLRIDRNNGEHYYLTYRTRTGYDSSLSSYFADRTSIHSYADTMTGNTRWHASLQDGETFEDSSGLTVTQVTHDAGGVTVTISDGSACPDADGDGVCDADDVCPGGDDAIDTDLDGVPDFCDACPGGDDAIDTDGDGMCDADDPDDDNDGTADSADCAPMLRGVTTLPGDVGASLRLDKSAGTSLTWNAGMQGPVSNVYRGAITVPWTDNESCSVAETATRSATDADLPASGNAYFYLIGTRNICGESGMGSATSGSRSPVSQCASSSLDSDGDSIPDLADTCPLNADSTLADSDGDFVGDVCDNCPGVSNPSQADLDGDSVGDSCDT